jgi:hypothetical protein
MSTSGGEPWVWRFTGNRQAPTAHCNIPLADHLESASGESQETQHAHARCPDAFDDMNGT